MSNLTKLAKENFVKGALIASSVVTGAAATEQTADAHGPYRSYQNYNQRYYSPNYGYGYNNYNPYNRPRVIPVPVPVQVPVHIPVQTVPQTIHVPKTTVIRQTAPQIVHVQKAQPTKIINNINIKNTSTSTAASASQTDRARTQQEIQKMIDEALGSK